MKSAVCVLIPMSGDHEFFMAISRRHNALAWGIPGGKVDPGESTLGAIIRETREETGVALDALLLEPLLCDVCPGKWPDDTYWVTTYLWKGAAPVWRSLVAEEGMTIRYMSRDLLSEVDYSPFFEYNQRVFEALDRYAGVFERVEVI